jgi:hypothetical protein
VKNLRTVWASIDGLCAGLSDGEWDRSTGCPDWSVKDHLSHLVGGRSDVPGDVGVTGDGPLGQRVLDAMGFLP